MSAQKVQESACVFESRCKQIGKAYIYCNIYYILESLISQNKEKQKEDLEDTK